MRGKYVVTSCVMIGIAAGGFWGYSKATAPASAAKVAPTPQKSILDSVAANDVAGVIATLAHGAQGLYERDTAGNDAFLLAASRGDSEMTTTLLKAGADIYSINAAGDSALHLAAASGELYTLRTLGERKFPLSQRNKATYTALEVAIEKGEVESVKELIKQGADLNEPYGSGQERQPLKMAWEAKRFDIANVLIEGGAAYVLEQCAFYGDMACLERHLKPNDSDPEATVMEEGIDYTPVILATSGGQLEALKFLVEHGADYNYITVDGTSCLSLACERESKPIVDYLISLGLSLDRTAVAMGGKHHLHERIRKGSPEFVKYLIEKGANPGVLDQENLTALGVAITTKRVDMLRALLDAKVSTEDRDGKGRTALLLARELGNEEAAKLLLEHGADATAVIDPSKAPAQEDKPHEHLRLRGALG